MANVEVINKARTYVTEPADPDDRWDRDNTATDNDIRGIRVVEERSYYDLQTAFDIDPTRPYFLVYAVYSTGDSFGHDEGRIEYVGLYSNLEVARENVRRIEEHDKLHTKIEYSRWGLSAKEKAELKKLEKKFEPYSVRLVTEDGQEFEVHVPWHGYFERLSHVDVEPVLVR